MSAVPLSHAPSYSQTPLEAPRPEPSVDWMRIGVGSSLVAGAVLLVTGRRKAGLVATAAGAALAMLEHRDLVSQWWESLPGHLQKAQQMLDQAQQTIEDLSSKRDRLMALFGR